MDSSRFDDLVKKLARGSSRRSIVKTLGGGAVAGVLAAVGIGRAGAADKVGVCHRTRSAKNPVVYITVAQSAVPAHLAHGDKLTDLTDVENCGACGNACAAVDACTPAACADGACSTASACGDGQTCCSDGTCVDLSTDVNNCGECGNVCQSEDICATPVCSNGTCGTTPVDNCCHDATECNDSNVCTTDTCENNRCVHTDVTWGTSCGTGQVCSGGACVGNGVCIAGDFSQPGCGGPGCGFFTSACLTDTEGAYICAGSIDCQGATFCPNGSTDCPTGFICLPGGGGCGGNTCQPICSGTGATAAGAAGTDGDGFNSVN